MFPTGWTPCQPRECTPDEFLAEILRREHEDPDVGWEALALLDQEFRRQRISREVSRV